MDKTVEGIARKAARAIARGMRKGIESPRALGLLVAMALTHKNQGR